MAEQTRSICFFELSTKETVVLNAVPKARTILSQQPPAMQWRRKTTSRLSIVAANCY